VAAPTPADLFEVDPNDFVKTRDAIARELKASGDAAAAAEVKKLRRPSVPVWALNQVAREHGDVVEQLLDAAHTARTAQARAISGRGADALRTAASAQRGAIDAVTAAAATVITASGRVAETQERDIENALAAIVASEVLSDRLRDGTLVSLEAGEDVDLFAGIEAPVRKPVKKKPAGPSRQLLRARENVERRRSELTDAEDALRDAERVRQRAADALARAEAALSDLESTERL
jgi:hypothetical protein